MRSLLIRGASVVTEAGVQQEDLLIEGGVIAKIGRVEEIDRETETLDLAGKIVLPGGVDVHTHLDSQLNGAATADDFLSGSIAAVCGGTTTIIDFSPQGADLGLVDSLRAHRQRADGRAVIDYGLHQCVTNLRTGSLTELPQLVAEGATSVKAFMAYRGTLMLEDAELRELFVAAAQVKVKVCLHAEDGDAIDALATQMVHEGLTGARGHQLSRPPHTEVAAVRRALAMVEETGASVYFVHISTAEAVQAIAEARSQGLDVAAETCTHYLMLDEGVYDADDAIARGYIIAPPLRSTHHQNSLWSALHTEALSVVSSDHCPYCLEEKNSPQHDDFRTVPNGAPGIEHRMRLLYSEGVAKGRLSLPEFVRVTATNPARHFGIYPQKGVITVGADADLIILDPAGTTLVQQEKQHQQVDYTPYHDWELRGRIERVYARGELVVKDDKFVADIGRGRFLHRNSMEGSSNE